MSQPKPPDKTRRRSSSSKPEHERTDGVYQVVVRNQSLYLTYQRLILAAVLSLVAAGVAVLALVLVMGKPVPPQYIPITQDGRLLPLVPLSEPNLDDGAIGEFALKTIREVNNYDYLSWKTQVLTAQPRFLPASWKKYLEEFEATNIIRTVVDRKMIVIGQPMGSVEIQNRGRLDDGVYVWRVAVPIKIQYIAHADSTQRTNLQLASEGVVTLYIQRVAPTLSASGIAVRAYQYEQTSQ